MRFEACDQGPDELPKLRACEGPRRVFSINEEWLILVVWIWATEGKCQEIGVNVLAQQRVHDAGGHRGIPVAHAAEFRSKEGNKK